MRLIALLMIATVAGAEPATNRMAAAKASMTNRVQHIEGKRQVVSLYKTQPKDRVRTKNASGKVVELPLMFDNNRIKELKQKKENKI